MTRNAKAVCRACPLFPASPGGQLGAFGPRRCPAAKRTVSPMTPACDLGRGRMLFAARGRGGKA